jgi:hypothetical protein
MIGENAARTPTTTEIVTEFHDDTDYAAPRPPLIGCRERILIRHTGLDLEGRRDTVPAIGHPVLGRVARQLHRPEHLVTDLPPRGTAMTLKPIPGAPIGAPIPDFPTGEPGPLVVPESRFARRPVPPSSPSPPLALARRPGPVEIRGSDASTLTFRAIPEVPAINRSSMTISITGEPTCDYSPQPMPQLNLSTDKAKAFLLALRDGGSPVVIADSRTSFQVEFAITEDGPVFTVSQPGQERTVRKINAGWSFDVKTMVAHLLADLGP